VCLSCRVVSAVLLCCIPQPRYPAAATTAACCGSSDGSSICDLGYLLIEEVAVAACAVIGVRLRKAVVTDLLDKAFCCALQLLQVWWTAEALLRVGFEVVAAGCVHGCVTCCSG
jgi:hypothetical protein